MNIIKHIVSESLRPFPKLRRFVSDLHKKSKYYIWKTKNIFKDNTQKQLSNGLRLFNDQKNHYFFGYYDKSPWNIENNKILFLKSEFAKRIPSKNDKIDIGFFDVKENKKNIIGESKAWSLQQGNMLQWLNGESDQLIIYNDFENGEYCSVIHDIYNGIKKKLPLPIYTISSNGKYALTLNFDRLKHTSPGYGYNNRDYKNKDSKIPKNDGIWKMNLESSKYKLIISYNDIINFQPKKEFKNSIHWVNHLEFNTNDKRFVFLHRWRYKNKRYSRMLTADIDGNDLYCLSDYDMVSHFTWKDNNHILAWARQPKFGDNYYIFKDKSEIVNTFAKDILDKDGHPSFSPDGRFLLTDTYPNDGRISTLILYDTKRKKRFDLGKYFSPFEYSRIYRCDLHPRWDRKGNKICFDSVHEGKRNIYILDVSSITNID